MFSISPEWRSVITWLTAITLIYSIANATVQNIYAEIDKKADKEDIQTITTDLKEVKLGVHNITYLLGYVTAKVDGTFAPVIPDSTVAVIRQKLGD